MVLEDGMEEVGAHLAERDPRLARLSAGPSAGRRHARATTDPSGAASLAHSTCRGEHRRRASPRSPRTPASGLRSIGLCPELRAAAMTAALVAPNQRQRSQSLAWRVRALGLRPDECSPASRDIHFRAPRSPVIGELNERVSARREQAALTAIECHQAEPLLGSNRLEQSNVSTP